MARIRTVKPELWTDPEFVELSLSARLMFIASLNFADDEGVLPDKPRQLKMQCLPADDVNGTELVGELIRARFYVRRVAPNGDRVLLIRTFAQHQRINRKSQGRWGDPAEWPNPQLELDLDSVSPHGGPFLEGKGREGKGKEECRRPTSTTGDIHNLGINGHDARYETVINLITETVINRHGTERPTNPDRYRTTITDRLVEQHGPRIVDYLDTHPDYPAELCAQALQLDIP